ncbi:MAG TPA: ABC transporter ATP-binding protein [Candidatus Megaira endosymbiont of Nemacystus decipiens]|nr:ABC transporter ATP-binding protein [Candidatus Megaera endosymbiont of Nemacystus decipiens]
MTAAIQIQNLVKKYQVDGSDDYLAIKSLDLTIPKGCIFGLLGPNGAGKSTLINILAGTVNKTSGTVKISDISMDEYPKKSRMQIGVVPQEIALDSFFPLYEGLECYAGYYGIRPEHRKTEEILKKLSLWDKRKTKPAKLSGGMKRRFLIAKALVHSPKVLILDEPTAGVDLDLRNHLWSFIRELKDNGITVILTTHYLAEAQELCDEIAFINKGQIIKQSLKNELLHELGQCHIDVCFMQDISSNITDSLSGQIEFDLIDKNKIRFYINKNNTYSAILKSIEKIGIEVKNMSVTQPDLEDIFYKIVHQNEN